MNRRILFLIRSLDRGGAEQQLVNLSIELKAYGYAPIVSVFYAGGQNEDVLIQAGIEVVDLKKRHRWDFLGLLINFRRLLNRVKPAVVYGFLTEGNLVALLAKVLQKETKVFWGVRTATADTVLRPDDRVVRLGFFLARILSRWPEKIIANSAAGRKFLVEAGFQEDKLLVVNNGVDGKVFYPSARERLNVRTDLGVKESTFLIGIVGRIDPIKNHRLFISAAHEYLKKRGDTRFIIVGGGKAEYERLLMKRIAQSNVSEHFTFVGEKDCVRPFYNAFDVTTICSISEAYPNVAIESLFCGIPCVGPRVGDIEEILQARPELLFDSQDVLGLIKAWDYVRFLKEDSDSQFCVELSEYVRRKNAVDEMTQRTLRVLGV